MGRRGLSDDVARQRVIEELGAEITVALQAASAVAPKPPLESLFDDVYATKPWHLEEQLAYLRAAPLTEQHH